MELSPALKPNSLWTRQEISLILSGPKVHYSLHSSPPFAAMLSQIINRTANKIGYRSFRVEGGQSTGD